MDSDIGVEGEVLKEDENKKVNGNKDESSETMTKKKKVCSNEDDCEDIKLPARIEMTETTKGVSGGFLKAGGFKKVSSSEGEGSETMTSKVTKKRKVGHSEDNCEDDIKLPASSQMSKKRKGVVGRLLKTDEFKKVSSNED